MDVVGIKFRGSNKVYHFLTDEIGLRPGDAVVALTEKGIDIGHVTYTTQKVENTAGLKKLLRRATALDLIRFHENMALENVARVEAQKLTDSMNLQMQFVVACYNLDRSKVTLYFMAEKRIDFREFVRELSKKLHIKVELWQIGQRDETRLFGGIGPCNKVFCCATFLNSKESVTIKDAKCQRLDINPQKITGMCGKLMCCLKYEVDTYKEALQDFPEDGETVLYSGQECKVQSVNPFARTATVTGPEVSIVTVKIEEISRNYHGEWIPAIGSYEKMSEQKAERARISFENAELAKTRKKKKKDKPGIRPPHHGQSGDQPSQGQFQHQSHEDQAEQEHHNHPPTEQDQPENPF